MVGVAAEEEDVEVLLVLVVGFEEADVAVENDVGTETDVGLDIADEA